MITNAPNQANPGNHANGSFPQPRGASPVSRNDPSDHANGSFPQGRDASPVNPPNAGLKFQPASSKMAQPPAAVQPGKGAVPVNPGVGGAMTMPAAIMRGR